MTPAEPSGKVRLIALLTGTTLLFAPDVPAQEPVVPPEEPGGPAEESDVPLAQESLPAEEPDGPAEEPDGPAEEPDGPAEHSGVPAEEPAVLAREPGVPASEPAVPDQEEIENDDGEAAGVDVFLFADAYYSFNTSSPVPGPGDRAHFPAHRAYDAFNGFNLSFLGADLTYDGGQIGATASLRVGSGAPIFFGDEGLSGEPTRFYPLTQAYLTWSPVPELTLDFGQFGTIFGAEVAESWQNLNYTRGALYYALQPFWHTGLRAGYQASELVGVNAMVVNGTNQAFVPDNNRPALALQVVLTPSDEFSLSAGYLRQLDPMNSDLYPGGGRAGFDDFVDVVAVVEAGALTVIGNFDYNATRPDEGSDADPTSAWGGSLAIGYAVTEMFGIALRGEYLKDVDAGLWELTDPEAAGEVAEGNHLITGTVTLESKPVENLSIRWDNRIEQSDQEIFFDRAGRAAETWFNSILGVVVKSE